MIAGYVGASVVALLIIAAVLVHLWPSMEPYHPPLLPSRGGPCCCGIEGCDGTGYWPDDAPNPRPVTASVALSRLRDTGGYLGGVHVDCLRARAAGEQICDECVPMLRGRITDGVT